jgi:hypothetical protein
MVSTCNFWLTIYPPKDGISRNINPRELITGVQIDFNKHAQVEFGECVQVHEEHDNTMRTRTTGAIATKPCPGWSLVLQPHCWSHARSQAMDFLTHAQ